MQERSTKNDHFRLPSATNRAMSRHNRHRQCIGLACHDNLKLRHSIEENRTLKFRRYPLKLPRHLLSLRRHTPLRYHIPTNMQN